MGHVKETPNVALQAKLSENFDFSNRTLEESKEPKAAATQDPEENERSEGEDQDDAEEDDGGFFDNFQKTGPDTRGRGGRGAREATN